MVHRIGWRVASTEALDFWEKRLGDAGYDSWREAEALSFADFEGLEHELRVSDVDDPPLIADHPEVPAELALQGFDFARAYSADPERSRPYLEDTLDVVVNNAADQTRQPVLEVDHKTWNRTLAVNLTGPLLVTRGAARSMPAGGPIVNVASIHAFIALRRAAAYTPPARRHSRC